MKKLLFVSILAAIVLGGIYACRQPLQHRLFEGILSAAAREFFQGPVRLTSGSIDRSFKMHLKDLQGTLISEGGPAPIRVERIDSTAPLLSFFKPEGTSLEFSGAKPEGSQNPGLSGRVELKSEDGGRFQLNANIDGLDFSEIEWMNPDNLRGARGLFTGSITSDGKFTEDPKFQLILASEDGLVQAKFFSALLPYLPALPTKDRLTKLADKNAVLPFKKAAVRAELKEPHKMTIALHIEIPDYNVVLNIHFEIRIEETLSFLQLAEIMGLVKVTV